MSAQLNFKKGFYQAQLHYEVFIFSPGCGYIRPGQARSGPSHRGASLWYCQACCLNCSKNLIEVAIICLLYNLPQHHLKVAADLCRTLHQPSVRCLSTRSKCSITCVAFRIQLLSVNCLNTAQKWQLSCVVCSFIQLLECDASIKAQCVYTRWRNCEYIIYSFQFGMHSNYVVIWQCLLLPIPIFILIQYWSSFSRSRDFFKLIKTQ